MDIGLPLYFTPSRLVLCISNHATGPMQPCLQGVGTAESHGTLAQLAGCILSNAVSHQLIRRVSRGNLHRMFGNTNYLGLLAPSLSFMRQSTSFKLPRTASWHILPTLRWHHKGDGQHNTQSREERTFAVGPQGDLMRAACMQAAAGSSVKSAMEGWDSTEMDDFQEASSEVDGVPPSLYLLADPTIPVLIPTTQV